MSANPVARLPFYDIRSPVFQAISYIPCVGLIPSIYARIIMIGAKQEAVKNNKNDVVLEVNKVSKEYMKIGVARNLLTVALVAGAIALGILSGPVGAILATLHLGFALTNLYLISRDNHIPNALNQTARV